MWPESEYEMCLTIGPQKIWQHNTCNVRIKKKTDFLLLFLSGSSEGAQRFFSKALQRIRQAAKTKPGPESHHSRC